jgi:hypothetical protein
MRAPSRCPGRLSPVRGRLGVVPLALGQPGGPLPSGPGLGTLREPGVARLSARQVRVRTGLAAVSSLEKPGSAPRSGWVAAAARVWSRAPYAARGGAHRAERGGVWHEARGAVPARAGGRARVPSRAAPAARRAPAALAPGAALPRVGSAPASRAAVEGSPAGRDRRAGFRRRALQSGGEVWWPTEFRSFRRRRSGHPRRRPRPRARRARRGVGTTCRSHRRFAR